MQHRPVAPFSSALDLSILGRYYINTLEQESDVLRSEKQGCEVMSRKTIYFPHNFLVFAVLLLILALVVGLIFIGVVGVAFEDVGFSPAITALILVATLIGSFINIPVLKLKTKIPIIKEEFVSYFGIIYRIPDAEYGETTTMVAVNVGGALIPTFVSSYLLWKVPSAMLYALVGVAAVALVTHIVARPVKGVGISTPVFIPPLVAALSAYILSPGAPRVIAYYCLCIRCLGNTHRRRSV